MAGLAEPVPACPLATLVALTQLDTMPVDPRDAAIASVAFGTRPNLVVTELLQQCLVDKELRPVLCCDCAVLRFKHLFLFG